MENQGKPTQINPIIERSKLKRANLEPKLATATSGTLHPRLHLIGETRLHKKKPTGSRSLCADLRIQLHELTKINSQQMISLDFGNRYPLIHTPLTQSTTLNETSSHIALLRVPIPKPHKRLKPGLFTMGKLYLEPEIYPVVVPPSRITHIHDQPYLFLPNPRGFIASPVILGSFDEDFVAILKGLNANEPYLDQDGKTLEQLIDPKIK